MRSLALVILLLPGFLVAQELQVHFLDVGQGDATLLVSPTGQTFLFDAGSDGKGNSVVNPLLSSLGIQQLDYVSASHYHTDHIGGLEEVWLAGWRASVALDRGNNNAPSHSAYQNYKNYYGSVRRTVQPGEIIDLGGGVTLKCLVVEGKLSSGQTVNISGSAQWENSSSIAYKVEYGNFDLFLGGDLTGGGNGSTDVESAVAGLCGNVDVYQVNHHGSRTSTNSTFVAQLAPEFGILSCGENNSYGYPKQEVVDRLNTSSKTIPLWSTTFGIFTYGYVDAGGNIALTTDGFSYTVTASDGTNFTSLCDEMSASLPTSGDLVVAEFMRDPVSVADSEGEWLEIAGARLAETTSLRFVTVDDLGSDSFTLGANIVLDAGEEILVAANGIPSQNGGFRPQIVWPRGRFALANSDSTQLRYGTSTLDLVSWTSSWPGGSGTSAERMDLSLSGQASNFASAISTYGNGDRGTPGQDNDNDSTGWGGTAIVVTVPPTVGGPLVMQWMAPSESNRLYQGWLTRSTTPGFNLNGIHIAANLDNAFKTTRNLPGWSGLVPANESWVVSAVVPNNPSLAGLTVYGILLTYQNIANLGLVVRTVSQPVLMTIQ